jgi:hypothetical protein
MNMLQKTKTESDKEIKQQPTKLFCPECFSKTEATCKCGVGYVTKKEAAAKYAEKHPEMTNVAIAEALGIDEGTVRKNVNRNNSESCTNKRGQSRPPTYNTKPKRPAHKPPEQEYVDRVEKAVALAEVSYGGGCGKLDEAIALARSVAAAWNKLADELAKQRKALN